MAPICVASFVSVVPFDAAWLGGRRGKATELLFLVYFFFPLLASCHFGRLREAAQATVLVAERNILWLFAEREKMFWRFGFHQQSAVDTLLEKPDVTVEQLLLEDDILQEVKSLNRRLLQLCPFCFSFPNLILPTDDPLPGQPIRAGQSLCAPDPDHERSARGVQRRGAFQVAQHGLRGLCLRGLAPHAGTPRDPGGARALLDVPRPGRSSEPAP